MSYRRCRCAPRRRGSGRGVGPWSRGQAAAAQLGTQSVDADATIELLCRNARAPAGVRTRRRDGLRPRGPHVAWHAGDHRRTHRVRPRPTGTDRHRGRAPGRVVPRHRHHHRRCGTRCGRAQGCTESAATGGGTAVGGRRRRIPKETWSRLLLARNGFPPVQTQIEVRDGAGRFVARIDMGWPHLKIAVDTTVTSIAPTAPSTSATSAAWNRWSASAGSSFGC